MAFLDLKVKNLTGHFENIQITESATVLDLKKAISAKLGPNAPYYRIKLIANYKGPRTGTVLENDTNTLASYSSTVTNNTTLFLLIEPPFKLYIEVPGSQIFEIEIPLKDPEIYTLSELRATIQNEHGHSLVNHNFMFNEKFLEEVRNGRQLTLKDHSIGKEDTLFVMRVGTEQDIIQPVVDICFMMDCTGSMSSWIDSVKNNVTTVRDRLDQRYKGCDLRVSFVRYTDYDMPEATRTTWLNFTSSLSDFHSFVNPIIAEGGGDGPEDIMGALKITLSSNLSWRPSSAKVLVHIADAPCHGTQYHSDRGDKYPNGDPAGITHDQMMREVADCDIQYWFGYIQRDYTDRMINVFNESLKHHSNQALLIRQFDATDPEQIANAIHKSVTVSVTASKAKKSSN